jgi:carbon-monoxide dehydrogenase medium subunit
MLNMRYVFPDHVVDLNAINDLAYLREQAGKIAIGSMTRQRDIELSELLRAKAPIFAEALHYVGHVQTRNRGMIGGSLCHLDPAAELPLLALGHDAAITVTGPRGMRSLQMREFMLASLTPAIEPNEIVSEISFSPWPPGHGYAFDEFARRHGDFAIAAAGVLLSIGKAGVIDRVSISVGGAAALPCRISEAEAFLIGKAPKPETLGEAAAKAAAIDAIEDAYYTASYRKHLAVQLVNRTLLRATERVTAPNAGRPH